MTSKTTVPLKTKDIRATKRKRRGRQIGKNAVDLYAGQHRDGNKIDLDKYCEAYLRTNQIMKSYCSAAIGEIKTENVAKLAGQYHKRRYVQARLGELAVSVCNQLQKKEQITAERIKDELSALGFATVADVCEWSGTTLKVKPLSKMTRSQVAAIKSVEEKEGGIKITMHDKTRALEAMAKILGMFTEITANLVVLNMNFSKTRGETYEQNRGQQQ